MPARAGAASKRGAGTSAPCSPRWVSPRPRWLRAERAVGARRAIAWRLLRSERAENHSTAWRFVGRFRGCWTRAKSGRLFFGFSKNTSQNVASGTARERPGGHGVYVRLPSTGIAASPALLVLFAARVRGAPARRQGGVHACAASNVALVRNRRAVPRVGFPAIKGNAVRETAFGIEPRAPASPAHRRVGVRAERAVEARRRAARRARRVRTAPVHEQGGAARALRRCRRFPRASTANAGAARRRRPAAPE